MQVTVEIPDDVARILTPQGQDPARVTLEAVAIDGYRSATLAPYQVAVCSGSKLDMIWTDS